MLLSAFTQFFDIDNVLFMIDGRAISCLEMLSIVFGLVAVFMASLGRSINYWFTYIYTILLFLLLLQKHLYTSMLLQPFCLAVNIYGLYRWTHPGSGETNARHTLKASFLTQGQRLLYPFAVLVFAFLWGRLLSRIHFLFGGAIPPATRPYIDAFVAGMTILSQWLAALKKWESWIAWIIVNATNIVLYILSGLLFMPFLPAVYILFNVLGIVVWRKESLQKKI